MVATAVGSFTDQAGQLAGFAVGGGLVAVVGSSASLGIDAGTFAVSALLVRFGVRARPAPRGAAAVGGRHYPVRSAVAGARLIASDARLRALLGYAWLCGFFVVPEGLAAPYAAAAGGGRGSVGLLMAAQPAGAVAGAVLLARWVSPAGRLRLIGAMAVLSCAPLIGCALYPGVPGDAGSAGGVRGRHRLPVDG